MAKTTVLTLDDENSTRSEKILRRRCVAINNPQDPEIVMLGQLMGKICSQKGVAGIAANQLGKNVRMFALSNGEGKPPLYFVNPKILSFSDETNSQIEGCLSVPGKGGYVTCPNTVKLRWQDHNKKFYEFEFKDFWARAVWHEMRHLNGGLYIDECEKIFTDEELEAKFKEIKEQETKENKMDLVLVPADDES